MFKKQLIVLLGLITLMLISCSPKQSEIVVATYDDSNIQMKEFEKAYEKNVGNLEAAKKDSLQQLKDFLDLYVVYKMKLADAEARHLDKDSSLIKELDEYGKTIGVSYYLEKNLYEKGMKDLYNKRSEELRISHILIRTDTISAKDAEKKAYDIIDQIKKGASFEEMAKKYSEDNFSKKKGGDIYYLTAGLVIPDFEDAAYSTPVGQVYQKPIKTKYGYHIIKVTDRRKRIPKVRAAHILLRVDFRDSTKQDSVYKIAKEIKDKLSKGEDFGKLAAKYSDDPGSKDKNGDLGYFSRRQMVQPFDEAVFNLKVGQVSDIVKTRFGYHLIKLLDAKPYPGYNKEKKTISSLYAKARKKRDKQNLIEKIEHEFNFVLFDNALKNILAKDTNKVRLNSSYWESELHNKVKDIPLLEINKKKYSLDDIVDYNLKNNKNIGKIINEKLVSTLVNEFKEIKLLELKAEKELKNNQEFVKLMDEYKNGIYIFKLQEEEVWNKIDMDSTKIKALFEKTKDQYIIPNQVEFMEIYSRNDSLIHKYYDMVKSGTDFKDVARKHSDKLRNRNNGGNEGLINADKNEAAKHAFALENEGDISGIFKNKDGWSIVKLIRKIIGRNKTFEEARAEVTSKFQDMESERLEKEYTNRLKETYKPKLFYEELKHAYKTN